MHVPGSAVQHASQTCLLRLAPEAHYEALPVLPSICFMQADSEDLATFLLASIPCQPWGPLGTEASRGGLPSPGVLACRGQVFLKQLGNRAGCSLAWQHLLGHVGCCGGDLPVTAAPQPGFSAVAGRALAGWLGQVPGQGLFPAKSFKGGGRKETVCETHFSWTGCSS